MNELTPNTVVIMKVDPSKINTVLDEYIEELRLKYEESFKPAKLVIIPNHVEIEILPI